MNASDSQEQTGNIWCYWETGDGETAHATILFKGLRVSRPSAPQITPQKHHAQRPRAEGIFPLERFLGTTILGSDGREAPVRLVGEQQMRENLGFVAGFADWVRCIRPEAWMGRSGKIQLLND